MGGVGWEGGEDSHQAGLPRKNGYRDTYKTVLKEVLFSFVNHCPHHSITFLEQEGGRGKQTTQSDAD